MRTRSVCKTNIRKAIRKALASRYGTFHDVNDEWRVYFNAFDQVCLWDWETDVEVHTGSVVWCGFDNNTEATYYLADKLLELYFALPEHKRPSEAMERHELLLHPWEALEGAERNAYENAYDYFVCGESYNSWVERGHDCGIDPSRRRAIWAMAFWSCADGEAPADYLGEYERLVSE